jgi:hypothetical protein
VGQKQIFPVSGNRNLRTINHFDIATIMANKFLDKIEVDQMGIMGTEEIPVIKQILKFLEML